MKTSVLALLTVLASTALAQSTTPQCVRTCGTQNPTSSFCDGDETGVALSNCTCQTLFNSKLLSCIKSSCSSSDLTTYANNLPQPCGSTLFPGLVTGGGSSSAAAGPTTTPTAGGGSTGTTPANTATGAGQSSSTTRPAAPTTTAPGAANGLVAPGLVLAAGPLVAAVLL
ncbi:uncharacterized protein B0I36DRAFT_315337 [Microdochium trichocladiopsis]|uniref:CFEM domain-containing protein n=1 Tax=Microdochium trichocladiopsis TaxID=1682393 RepID=A0A9P9BV13_9PEZI|nr:uncharacterized protein B0I36DRAFT_315337 [Microdochium trichocladiopsis]KAH7038024.1 hypothetical protein B0I36DRAFT_315337 [Microdochium trichocladiopsis]